MIQKTLLLFGDEARTTSLLYLYDKEGQSVFSPLEFDAFSSLHPWEIPYVSVKTMTIDGEDYRVTIKEFSGHLWDYDVQRCRELINFSDFDVFIVVFSFVETHTFLSVKEQWIPYLKQHHPNTPIILVGNDTDLRSNSETLARLSKRNMRPIKTEEGYELARKINAIKYLECSCETKMGVRNIFYEAVWATLGPIPEYCIESDP